MMDFEKRLERAIERGQRESSARAQERASRALSEQELRRLYSQYRIELSEHIENNLRQLTDHLPGFQLETVVGERGWGAAVSRDDLGVQRRGDPRSLFSRLEIVVRPLTASQVLDMAVKGTIRNKELSNRSHYQPLAEADLHTFRELIDVWVLEFAEAYAAHG